MNEMMPYILEQPDLCQRMLANCAALAAPLCAGRGNVPA